MKVLLDTDICIEILRGKDRTLMDRVRTLSPEAVQLSALVVAELWVGVSKSRSPLATGTKVEAFVSKFPVIPFTTSTALRYGAIRASLEQQGKTIGPIDLLISASAVEHGLTLITRNHQEFKRVPGLQVESW